MRTRCLSLKVVNSTARPHVQLVSSTHFCEVYGSRRGFSYLNWEYVLKIPICCKEINLTKSWVPCCLMNHNSSIATATFFHKENFACLLPHQETTIIQRSQNWYYFFFQSFCQSCASFNWLYMLMQLCHQYLCHWLAAKISELYSKVNAFIKTYLGQDCTD